MAIIDIDGTPGSLVPPFNPDKLNELLVAALATGGFTIPPLILSGVGSGNTLLNVSVPEGTYTPQQVTQIVAILNAVAADPTRNQLTQAQQDAADLAVELTTINTNIAALTADIALVNGPGGYKDQINATTTGLKDQIKNSVWNPLTNAQKVDLLHTVVQAMLDIQIGQLNIDVDEAKSAKTSLKEAKTRLKIV